MKTIQEELGGVSNEQEIEDMRQKAKTKSWNEKVSKNFDKELSKYNE
jgi:ATP-dependent Lon protease